MIYDAGDAKRCGASSLVASGGNNDAAALDYAAEVARRSRRRAKVLVMVSDGLPTECSTNALKGLVNRLTRERMCVAQVAVCPLGGGVLSALRRAQWWARRVCATVRPDGGPVGPSRALRETMGDKLTLSDVTVGSVWEATFWVNPVESSRFRFRATHLGGKRAPKVVLTSDARITRGHAVSGSRDRSHQSRA